ncbi:MAG: glycosyltransferase [Candidatus Omnitrophota bacterium]
MKIDLHCHTKYSGKPSDWFLRKLGCPESFTDPKTLYRAALRKGMTHVTITDHDQIEGALEISHLPHTFLSEEVTAYFPEDRMKQHILVYRITEAQHDEIQKLRQNLYELVAYLQKQKIFHAIAHPLFSTHSKLTFDRFEKILLLFKVLELNGSRNEELNLAVRKIARLLTPKAFAHLIDKHGIVPSYEDPWEKIFIGGSDDHSGLTLACRYTEVPHARNVQDFFDGILAGKGSVIGRHATPQSFSRNIYGIVYQYYKNNRGIRPRENPSQLFNFLDLFLTAEAKYQDRASLKAQWRFAWKKTVKFLRGTGGKEFSLITTLKKELRKMLRSDPETRGLFHANTLDIERMDQDWFLFVNRFVNRLAGRIRRQDLPHYLQNNLAEIFQALSSASLLLTSTLPVLIGYSLFSKDVRFSHQMIGRFQPPNRPSKRRIKIGHVTDTLYETNGVAQTLQRQVDSAIKTGKDYTVIACTDEHPEQPGIKHFLPVNQFCFEAYQDQRLFIPPFFEMLDYCYTQKFTHIHASTPGPLGLAALGIAKLLNLPFVGTYHTAFPEYMRYLVSDPGAEQLMGKLMLWFYRRMDCVFVPSRNTARDLIRRGLDPAKVRIYPRGVDTERFYPARDERFFHRRFGLNQGIKLLYVGRISREKNLPVLEEAFKRLSIVEPKVQLIVTGEGPYLEEMRSSLRGFPCLFTGKLKEKDLVSVYASSDLFIFPSTTDTFGNVVLEAQACGLPVIVTDAGGPQENILADKTGVIIPGMNVPALLQTMKKMISDPAKLRGMGQTARAYAENRSFERSFAGFWEMHQDIDEHDDAQGRETKDDEIEKILIRLASPLAGSFGVSPSV